MNDQASQPALLSALTTEHFAAQSAASTTAAESGTRATLYVIALSSSLVAIGFAAQSKTAFVPLAAAVIRSLSRSASSPSCGSSKPACKPWSSPAGSCGSAATTATWPPKPSIYETPGPSETDDVMAELGVSVAGPLPPFFTLAMMIATINGIVGGSGAALLAVAILGTGQIIAAALPGLAMFTATVAACRIYPWRS